MASSDGIAQATSFTSDAGWASGTSLRTPFVAVHRQRLQAQIDRIGALARRQEVWVRPHAKTHQCPEIARLQVDASAVGITVAKPEEARVFLRAGIASVTLAYPVIDSTAGLHALQCATAGRTERHWPVCARNTAILRAPPLRRTAFSWG